MRPRRNSSTSPTVTAMRLDSKFLSLPASIIFLIASYSETVHASDKTVAVRASFNRLSKWLTRSGNRDVEFVHGEERRPVGVMKMSDDEGEKFYMEYWQFGGDTQEQAPLLNMEDPALRRRNEEARLLLANVSTPISYRPAFALHTAHDAEHGLHGPDLKPRGREVSATLAVLQNRQFSCPTGTTSCSGIGYPNSCCSTDETCFQIKDTGLGPVGCCPNGSNCGGQITSCDAPDTACPDSLGGGCCIPNYVCAGVGWMSSNVGAKSTGEANVL
jgi:hypothetical protein